MIVVDVDPIVVAASAAADTATVLRYVTYPFQVHLENVSESHKDGWSDSASFKLSL